MRTKPALLSIGVLLAAALTAMSRADDWSGDKGNGLTPMAPTYVPTSPGYRERSIVPGAPVQPSLGQRPEAWPGAPVDATGIAQAKGLPGGDLKPCEGAAIIARVGDESILASEIMPNIKQLDELIEKNKDHLSARQIEEVRKEKLQPVLRNRIETRLILQDAKKTIPAEGLKKFETEQGEAFENKDLPDMMKSLKVKTRAELDQRLREMGTSIERQKRSSIDRQLATAWVHERVLKSDAEVPRDQQLTYYREHQDEFTTPARAQYEELMVRFSKYPNDRKAAWDAIAQMGNQVVAGRPFAEVAKANSDGATADKGGQWPWTTKGSLACEKLDQALFDPNLAVGQLSPIIETPQGFQIIRVTQREALTVKPFSEAQVEIRKKIPAERDQKLLKEYLAKLEAKTAIWTMFDGDIANPQLSSRPASQPLR